MNERAEYRARLITEVEVLRSKTETLRGHELTIRCLKSEVQRFRAIAESLQSNDYSREEGMALLGTK